MLARDLFYHNPSLFGSQEALDSLIDEAVLVIQVPRCHLHVVFMYMCVGCRQLCSGLIIIRLSVLLLAKCFGTFYAQCLMVKGH